MRNSLGIGSDGLDTFWREVKDRFKRGDDNMRFIRLEQISILVRKTERGLYLLDKEESGALLREAVTPVCGECGQEVNDVLYLQGEPLCKNLSVLNRQKDDRLKETEKMSESQLFGSHFGRVDGGQAGADAAGHLAKVLELGLHRGGSGRVLAGVAVDVLEALLVYEDGVEGLLDLFVAVDVPGDLCELDLGTELSGFFDEEGFD